MPDLARESSRIKVSALRQALARTDPQHDTPIGKVHPYWARKPLNVVETIIAGLSDPGDTVVDPFMGSGTTLFAALKLGRRAVGGDISPLSHLLVEGLLDVIAHAEVVLPAMREVLDRHADLCLPWFQLNSGAHVERTRYSVEGEFAHGRFKLIPTEVVVKVRAGAGWSGRRALSDPDTLSALAMIDPRASALFDSPLAFSQVRLPPNSRIAIPEGATLDQFFTPLNRASINAFLQLLDDATLTPALRSGLRLLLSSALPLLRLSDRKASSQWPYWRPKTALTSRNPVVVLDERFRRLTEMATWGRRTLGGSAPFVDSVRIRNVAAQDLDSSIVGKRVALVLTDPPYGDQVPYIEYSSLWNGVLGLSLPTQSLENEMVRSDAAHRKADSDDYLARLEDAFRANARLVDDSGYLVWFYQDQDLHCWKAIQHAARAESMQLVDVIPLPKQRRSLKTVTSPNTTLDGDLVCVFERSSSGRPALPTGTMSDLSDSLHHEGSYFEKYALLIEMSLKGGYVDQLADKYGSVKNALAGMVV